MGSSKLLAWADNERGNSGRGADLDILNLRLLGNQLVT